MNKEDKYIFRENEVLVIIHSKFRKWVFVGCEFLFVFIFKLFLINSLLLSSHSLFSITRL